MQVARSRPAGEGGSLGRLPGRRFHLCGSRPGGSRTASTGEAPRLHLCLVREWPEVELVPNKVVGSCEWVAAPGAARCTDLFVQTEGSAEAFHRTDPVSGGMSGPTGQGSPSPRGAPSIHHLPPRRMLVGALNFRTSLSRGEAEVAERMSAATLPERPRSLLPCKHQHTADNQQVVGGAHLSQVLCINSSNASSLPGQREPVAQPDISFIAALRFRSKVLLGCLRPLEGWCCICVAACILGYIPTQPGQVPNRQVLGDAQCS